MKHLALIQEIKDLLDSPTSPEEKLMGIGFLIADLESTLQTLSSNTPATPTIASSKTDLTPKKFSEPPYDELRQLLIQGVHPQETLPSAVRRIHKLTHAHLERQGASLLLDQAKTAHWAVWIKASYLADFYLENPSKMPHSAWKEFEALIDRIPRVL